MSTPSCDIGPECDRATRGGGSGSEYGVRIAGYRDEIVSVQEQEALVRDELEGIQSLAAKKLVSLARVRALERTIAELEGRHAALRTTIATAG